MTDRQNRETDDRAEHDRVPAMDEKDTAEERQYEEKAEKKERSTGVRDANEK